MISLAMAVNKYFGRKEGQSLAEFANEIGKLTMKDKLELLEMLKMVTNEEISLESQSEESKP